MTQLERIDIALQRVGLSRAELATQLCLSRQAIYRLARRPGSSLTPEHLAHASRILQCDLYWLCTGQGVPTDGPSFSFLAMEVARLLDAMAPPERERAFILVYQMSRGSWPAMPANAPMPGHSAVPAGKKPLK